MFTLATLGVAQGFYISGRCPEGRIGLKACKIKNLRVTLRVVIGEKAGYAKAFGVAQGFYISGRCPECSDWAESLQNKKLESYPQSSDWGEGRLCKSLWRCPESSNQAEGLLYISLGR